MGGKLDLLQQARKKELQVNIDHHYAAKVYTTGSPITGTVTFTPRKDTPFESIQVSFVGLARVRRDDLDFPKTATHWFLSIDMSDSELIYPGSKVFRAHETYTFPFNFIVPDHLTVSSCRHKVDSEYVRSSHTCLPPSMGTWEKDDMTVASSRVEYSIQADIVTQSSKKGAKISNKQVLNVLPYSPEEPPLDVSPINIQYCMHNDKKVRKNVISPADGRLRAVASQPRAINLDSDGNGASESTVHVTLEFESKSASIRPPKIGNASATLQAQTWSRQSPNLNLPNMGLLRDAYTNYATVLSKSPVKATWVSDTKGKEADIDSKSTTSHSAAVQIPFTLPLSNKNMWIPSFHNCLISRTYKLDLNLEVGNTTLRFNIPVQIAMETLDFPLAANIDGWTPESIGMDQEWLGLNGRYSNEDLSPQALRTVGDVLPDYHA